MVFEHLPSSQQDRYTISFGPAAGHEVGVIIIPILKRRRLSQAHLTISGKAGI